MRCRQIRGLLAAAVYDDLGPGERLALDGHLASCPACRIEAESLKTFTTRIPISQPQLDMELLPGVRRKLRVVPAARRRPVWRYAMVASFCIVIMAVGIGFILQQSSIQVPRVPEAKAANDPDPSPIYRAIQEAAILADNRDYTKAYTVLKQVVEENADDPAAGEAQLKRADLAFSMLHWYPEACEDYESLAQYYPAVFRSSPEGIARLDVLAEARKHDFASLYALDAARRGTVNAFAQLERVVARYPATFVASAAAEDMAHLVAREAGVPEGENPHLAAMACARDRCADVTAKEQLQLEVAHIYRRELKDPAKARELYTEVSSTENTVLAQLARKSLAELEASDQR